MASKLGFMQLLMMEELQSASVRKDRLCLSTYRIITGNCEKKNFKTINHTDQLKMKKGQTSHFPSAVNSNSFKMDQLLLLFFKWMLK